MTNYAEHLGIDLDKLEAERYHHYVTSDVTPKSSDDWQKLAKAAEVVGRSLETMRRWVKADFVMAKKQKTAIYVYMPDVIRHAGKA